MSKEANEQLGESRERVGQSSATDGASSTRQPSHTAPHGPIVRRAVRHLLVRLACRLPALDLLRPALGRRLVANLHKSTVTQAKVAAAAEAHRDCGAKVAAAAHGDCGARRLRRTRTAGNCSVTA